MSATSVFQRLPPHIAQSIICYLIPPFEDYPEKEWLVLYDVSHFWRILATERFYQRASIVASPTAGQDKLEFPFKPAIVKADTVLLSHVKEVDVVFENRDGQPSERRLYDFSSTWPVTLVFPKARSLSIDVSGFIKYYETIGETPGANEYMWIAQRIRTSMPKLQKADVRDSGFREYLEQAVFDRTKWNADNLLLAIFEKVTNVDFSARPIRPASGNSFMQHCSQLVQLEFDCMFNVDLLHHIAKEAAKTLETLRIVHYPYQTIKLLVVDDNDQPVVYPRLRKLDLNSFSDKTPESTIKIDKSISLFPVLRYLKWASKYAFEDDALFRGNSDTLEYLDIQLGPELINILQRCNVFSASKYLKLCHIKVCGGFDTTHINFDNESCLKHIGNGLSPAIQFLSISAPWAYWKISNTIFANPNSKHIQVMCLDSIVLSFSETINLIMRLPNLTSLESIFDGNVPELESIGGQGEAFIDELYEKHYPLRHRLKYWLAGYSDVGSMLPLVGASIVLAMLCPNFVSTQVPYFRIGDYQREIKDAIASRLYGKHTRILERVYKKSIGLFTSL